MQGDEAWSGSFLSGVGAWDAPEAWRDYRWSSSFEDQRAGFPTGVDELYLQVNNIFFYLNINILFNYLSNYFLFIFQFVQANKGRIYGLGSVQRDLNVANRPGGIPPVVHEIVSQARRIERLEELLRQALQKIEDLEQVIELGGSGGASTSAPQNEGRDDEDEHEDRDEDTDLDNL